MTIGMVAFGRNAGLGVFKGLEAAEKVAEGSIWGFAAYRVITKEDQILTYETQRGGTTTLITRGETTGGLPPKEVQEAQFAAIISSGPDRVEPLAVRVLPASPKVGLVTGHRNSSALLPDRDIQANKAVLELMKQGMTAPDAVKTIMNKYPKIDAGIVAVDINGNVGYQSSVRVRNRPDVLEVMRENQETGCKVAVIINEIYPKDAATIAAAKCMQIMTGERELDLEITIRAGLKVKLTDEDRVVVNENLEVTEVTTTDPEILKGECGGIVPYINAKVIKGTQVIGYTISEPVIGFKDGVIIDFLGQKEFKVPVKLYKSK